MKNKHNHIDIYIHLTQDELFDYANDILSNEEMYRIELHLNECELCNDAIEGISALKKPNETLQKIHQEILPTKPKKNNFFILKIAASVALIALFGLSYWLLNKNSPTQNLAENIPAEQKEIAKKATPIIEDTSEPLPIPENEIIEKELTEESSSSANLIQPTEIVSVQSDKQKLKFKTEEAEGATLNNDLLIENEDDLTISAPVEDFLDEITNEQGLGQSSPMAARSAKKSVAEHVAALEDQKEPIPQGGMSTLKDFIAKNLTYPQEAIDNKTKGTVVLEVTVSANGAIKNIIIIKSVGDGCDAEAMRLITAGPSWTPAVANGVAFEEKRQVKIKFKK